MTEKKVSRYDLERVISQTVVHAESNDEMSWQFTGFLDDHNTKKMVESIEGVLDRAGVKLT